MNYEPRERYHGQTISEFIKGLAGDLDGDAVVLIGVISMGRDGFGFHGADLAAFVRRCIIAMVKDGARPVLGGGDSGYYWILQPQYGSTPMRSPTPSSPNGGAAATLIMVGCGSLYRAPTRRVGRSESFQA